MVRGYNINSPFDETCASESESEEELGETFAMTVLVFGFLAAMALFDL